MARKRGSKTVDQPVAEVAEELSSPPAEKLVEMLRRMLEMRRLEERAAQAYGQGRIGGFCHLYIGQEAVAVGALATLRPTDTVLTTYRDHGMALVKGIRCALLHPSLLQCLQLCHAAA